MIFTIEFDFDRNKMNNLDSITIKSVINRLLNNSRSFLFRVINSLNDKLQLYASLRIPIISYSKNRISPVLKDQVFNNLFQKVSQRR